MYTRKMIKSGGNPPIRQPTLKREPSIQTKTYSYKPSLRQGMIYYSCRISLLSRMVMEHVRKDNIRAPSAIQRVVSILLKDRTLKAFITDNRGDAFRKIDNYSVSDTIEQVKKDLHDEYFKKVRRSARIPKRARFNMLFPFVFMDEKDNIQHYFILYYEKGSWYIYSSYASDFVRIGIKKLKVNLDDFVHFMECMYTTKDKIFMESFFRTYFLSDPTQQMVCVEDYKGDNKTYTVNKEKGVTKEIEMYTTSIRVVYVPEFKEHLRELMEVNRDKIQPILEEVGLSLKPSTSSAT